MKTLHACSVPGCGRLVPSHLLMCKPHWFTVPSALRAAVWGAWESYQAGDLSIESLRAVQQSATDAVSAALDRATADIARMNAEGGAA